MGGTQAAPSRTATSEGSNENNRKAGATPREVRSDDSEDGSVSDGASKQQVQQFNAWEGAVPWLVLFGLKLFDWS